MGLCEECQGGRTMISPPVPQEECDRCNPTVAECQHDWRQKWDWEYEGEEGEHSIRIPYPDGYYCTKCLTKSEE